MKKYLIPIAIVLMAFIVQAQDLITDRPDFTESAQVVPVRSVQIETGAELVSPGDGNELSYPSTLVRIGVHERFEVRLGLPGWTRFAHDGSSSTYFNDLLLETKLQLGALDSDFPFALIGVATIPAGDDEVSAGESEFGVKVAVAHDLTESVGVGANVGVLSVPYANDRTLVSLASLAFGIGLTPKLGLFLETFAEIPQEEVWAPVFDAGFTYLLTPLAQLDLYFGLGLNDAAPDQLLGAGFSIRL